MVLWLIFFMVRFPGSFLKGIVSRFLVCPVWLPDSVSFGVVPRFRVVRYGSPVHFDHDTVPRIRFTKHRDVTVVIILAHLSGWRVRGCVIVTIRRTLGERARVGRVWGMLGGWGAKARALLLFSEESVRWR